MSRLLAAAAGLACLAALAGCIFLTPPTGLRLGGQPLVAPSPQETTVALQRHEAPDFRAVYPPFWAPGAADRPLAPGITLLVAIGAQSAEKRPEGLFVIRFDGPFVERPLAAQARAQLEVEWPGARFEPEVESRLGGEPATRFSGTAELEGTPYRFVARAAVHAGKGYMAHLLAPEGRFTAEVFDTLLEAFVFKSPGSAPSPSPAG